jgi:TPR repeat protein
MNSNSDAFLAVVVGLIALFSVQARADNGEELYGEMNAGKCSPALTTLQAQATAGNAESQYLLGAAYSNGVCLPKDSKRWIDLLSKAAGQGHAVARFSLAIAYEFGEDVELDERRAVELYRSLAEQNVGVGQFNLGRTYENGRGGLEKDDRQAVDWYRKSANNGVAAGQKSLGRMYEEGRGGLKRDMRQAQEWHKKAASRRSCRPNCNEYCEFSPSETPVLAALMCLVSFPPPFVRQK